MSFQIPQLDRRLSVAPMLDWTDRHCRYFLRGFSRDMLLYTEMLTASAILRGDRDWLLGFRREEHPVALQLGGCEPEMLAIAARYGAEEGYDEINLNCGCPSDKVQKGAFGACLMSEPGLVADCVAAMREVVDVPVTVKMRIGTVRGRGAETLQAVQQFDEPDYDALCDFIVAIRAAGVDAAIVHARKAVLGGLSPAENREIPPLRYDVVQRIKEDFPDLPVVVNGGIRTVEEAMRMLDWCDGVMLGREAYHRPMVLGEIDAALRDVAPPTMADLQPLLERMAVYAEQEMARGERLTAITRHMLGLLSHARGAKEFRRLLSEGARETGAGPELIRRAAQLAAA
jgi:tRNA-dihydrouridine synthase A